MPPEVNSFLPAAILPLATGVAAIAAVAAVAAKAAAAAIFFRLGFIDSKRPAVELPAVETSNSPLAFAVITHFYESKSSGAAGFPVGNDIYSVNRAVCLKEGPHRSFCCVEAEVSNKNILHIIFFSF
jgi:hypothetical protein